MRISELLPDVRSIINDDTESGNRWSSDKIAGFIQQSIVLLNCMRPESRYVNGVLTELDFGEDLTEFDIPEEYSRWYQGFVYFAAAKCLEEDASDTANMQLSADFMSKATSRFQL